jgi:hypothetical protein
MVQTFPAVRRAAGGGTWLFALVAFVMSSAAAGALLGFLLGSFGQLAPAPLRLVLLLVTAGLATALEFHVPLPRPQRRAQVPSGWRRLPPVAFTSFYGALLGAGVFTYVPHATFYVVLAGAVVVGPTAGAFLMLIYGISRAVPVLLTIRWPIERAALAGLSLTRWGRPVRRLNAIALLAATLSFGVNLLGRLPAVF